MDAEGTQRVKLFTKIGLATKTDRAIDLSCRACGAGAWALGLDSRLGTPASLPSFFPTSDMDGCIDRWGERGRDIARERERERESDIERERERETESEKERERERGSERD